ncbi:MAG: 4-hydroxy-3-methylbut-2-enyl diphosphate reductase [Treponema sp.]|jgi:4-hydroxy-3-methylbut-2-enyl diphosphate reductase|nr:4-hydroxy-3-methylbut-2-enyl diphosphate reductase [Treponema sp.]
MQVIRAKVLGFCMGVRRAVELACLQTGPDAGDVFTLGPLIHNPQTLADLKSRGVEILDENCLPEKLNNVSVIIRAHGVAPQVEAALRQRGAVIIDATCPRVKASQVKAKTLAESGFRLFLAGEACHAEIAGIRGYAAAAPFCAVVGNAAEAEAAAAALYAESSGGKTALVGQTTISAEEYSAVGEAIQKYFPKLEIIQTICAAATDRQESLRELLDTVDAVIIAGGRASANTRRLETIAGKSGKPCVLVEDAAGIPQTFFSFRKIGLCAGASTPDSVIDAIEQRLAGSQGGAG